MKKLTIVLALGIFAAGDLAAQQMPSKEQQIAAATLPLAEAFRAEASVRSISADLKVITLRKGTGSMVCSIIEPESKTYLAYCENGVYAAYFYRQSQLQAELAKNGKPADAAEVKAALQKEMESGRITRPTRPAIGFMLRSKAFDWKTNTPSADAEHWETIQVPDATGASLALPNNRVKMGEPWVMAEGTPGAHIMCSSSDLI
jgi:hypothetical protein